MDRGKHYSGNRETVFVQNRGRSEAVSVDESGEDDVSKAGSIGTARQILQEIVSLCGTFRLAWSKYGLSTVFLQSSFESTVDC